MDTLGRVAWGVGISAIASLVSKRRGSLSTSGAWAAAGVGSVVFGAGGPAWFAVLLSFFVTSSGLGKLGARRKAATKQEFSKGDTRDALQVLANGGVAAAAALAFAISPRGELAAAFLGALATANADTWATEIGVLSRGRPWSIQHLRRVPRGTSGAVSPLGTAATLGGACLVGAVASVTPQAFAGAPLQLFTCAAVGGFAGAFADSWLGATVQAGYRCPRCEVDTEGRLHHCQTPTEHSTGVAFVDNDVVNLAATVTGSACAVGLFWGLFA